MIYQTVQHYNYIALKMQSQNDLKFMINDVIIEKIKDKFKSKITTIKMFFSKYFMFINIHQ